MPDSRIEKNVLLGVLALEMDFISSRQLLGAAGAWVLKKSRPLSRVLLDQGILDHESCVLLEGLVEKHVRFHGNKVERSLATVRCVDRIADGLRGLGDRELADVLDKILQARRAKRTPAAKPSESADLPGGRFRILRLHGLGGVGRLSVARDEELRRDVALKELQQRYADEPDSRSYLLFEAEVTGSLEHPAIVPIYGLGRYSNGRPFYAMRFIGGESLQEAIWRLHHADVADRSRADWELQFRRLLDHFLMACNAAEYAHGRGVVHRDLNPGNIMLGELGETYVVNWGSAKIETTPEAPLPNVEAPQIPPVSPSDDSAVSRAGSTPATTPYTSPEQAAGRLEEVGPAGDVYSLGATLYCLLTGRAPCDDEPADDLPDRIQRGEFPPPRRVKPAVARALEAICLKSMSTKSRDRYASAGALAEDVRRWVADQAITARREGPWERISRWSRRHVAATQAAAAALLLLLIILVVVALAASAARRRDQAASRNTLARFQEVRAAADGWLTGVGESMEYYPGADTLHRRLLREAAEGYEQFARQPTDDPGLEAERGRAYVRLGETRRLLGEPIESEAAYRQAMSIFTALGQSHPRDRDLQLESADTRLKLAGLLAEIGQRSEADEVYRAAVVRLRRLAQDEPDDLRVQQTLASGLTDRASLLRELGRRQEAEEHLKLSIAHFEELLKSSPGKPEYMAGLAKARGILGHALVDGERVEDALVSLDNAIGGLDTLVDAERRRPEYLASRALLQAYLAGVLQDSGQYARGLDAYGKAVDDYRSLAGTLPDLKAAREGLATAQTNLARLLQRLGRSAEAESHLNEALPVLERLAAEDAGNTRYLREQAACCDVLGLVLRDLSRDPEAKAACESAVEQYSQLATEAPEDPRYRECSAVSRGHLAQVLHELGDDQVAEEHYRGAIADLDELVQQHAATHRYHDELASICNQLGLLFWDAGKPDEGKEGFYRARDLWQTLTHGKPHVEHLDHFAWFLANCADPQLRDPLTAVRLAEQATSRVPQNAAYCNTLATALYRVGRWQPSVETLQEAIRLRGKTNAWDSFFLAMAWHQLGLRDEAAESYRHAQQWMDENCPGNSQLKRIRDEAATLLGAQQP
ncbi:MAG: tetratricopeptide repeat protein [Pirellulales bacterium]|nr:tetratricopeptide repeat protein [Pirellulales bacterium]